MGKIISIACFSVKLKLIPCFLSALAVLVKKLEHFGCSITLFGTAYHYLFYRKMVHKEIQMASLKPGDKILHIGCGPLPLTAYELYKNGFLVEAIDNDPGAADKAKNFLKLFACSNSIKVKNVDGMNTDFSSFAAVWVSLHACPKDKVLKKAFSTLPEGSKLVYRNPRGWLAFVYPRVEPEIIAPRCLKRRCNQFLSKETVVVTRVSPDKSR